MYTIPDLENLAGKELPHPSYLKGYFRVVERIAKNTYRMRSEARIPLVWNFVGSTEFVVKFPYEVKCIESKLNREGKASFGDELSLVSTDGVPFVLNSVKRDQGKLVVKMEGRGIFGEGSPYEIRVPENCVVE